MHSCSSPRLLTCNTDVTLCPTGAQCKTTLNASKVHHELIQAKANLPNLTEIFIENWCTGFFADYIHTPVRVRTATATTSTEAIFLGNWTKMKLFEFFEFLSFLLNLWGLPVSWNARLWGLQRELPAPWHVTGFHALCEWLILPCS